MMSRESHQGGAKVKLELLVGSVERRKSHLRQTATR
jgi:hypothetical protein